MKGPESTRKALAALQGPAEAAPPSAAGGVRGRLVPHGVGSTRNVSPRMAYGVLACHIVMLQNDMLRTL